MVELPGPRRAEPQPLHTFTVELSQTDIETGELEAEAAPAPPAPVPTPATAPAASPVIIDTPWYAEDIERLPEASRSLGQLALENFEPFPSLPLRPDLPQGSRTGAATPHLQGK